MLGNSDQFAGLTAESAVGSQWKPENKERDGVCDWRSQTIGYSFRE